MGHIIFLKKHGKKKIGGRSYVDKWLEDELVSKGIARKAGVDLLKQKELKTITDNDGNLPEPKKTKTTK